MRSIPKRFPFNAAIDISDADDRDVQFVLSQAYEQGKSYL